MPEITEIVDEPMDTAPPERDIQEIINDIYGQLGKIHAVLGFLIGEYEKRG